MYDAKNMLNKNFMIIFFFFQHKKVILELLMAQKCLYYIFEMYTKSYKKLDYFTNRILLS